MLDGFLSSMKDLSSTARSAFPSVFFGLGVTNKAAKPDCVLPIGDNGSLYDDCSSGELIVMIINETQLSWRQQSCQKCKHRQSHFDFQKNVYSVSLFKRNNALAKIRFSQNPIFLLLRIYVLFSINQHLYSHDRFSKISTPFCVSRNW